MLQQKGAPNIHSAVHAFEQGLALAREQKALAWELRVATSMARALTGNERFEAARRTLGEIYAQFTEGRDRPDLTTAAKLLGLP